MEVGDDDKGGITIAWGLGAIGAIEWSRCGRQNRTRHLPDLRDVIVS